MIGGALVWQLNRPTSAASPADRSFTTGNLSATTVLTAASAWSPSTATSISQRGSRCEAWAGAHPFGGRCGLDLTNLVDESPHGRSKLRLLKKVGTLERGEARQGTGSKAG